MTSECSGSVIRGRQARILPLECDNGELRASQEYRRALLDRQPETVELLATDSTQLGMNPTGLRMPQATSFEQVQDHRVYPLIAAERCAAFRTLNENVLAVGPGGWWRIQRNGFIIWIASPIPSVRAGDSPAV